MNEYIPTNFLVLEMRRITCLPFHLCKTLLIEFKGDIPLAIRTYRTREQDKRLSRPGATDIDWGF